jgi:formylmethanofuran dehydrogenase subunit E
MEKTLWEQVVDFHGHECIRLASGFRVAEAAITALGGGRDIEVMEPRARVKGGQPVCIPCLEKYTRGWGECFFS